MNLGTASGTSCAPGLANGLEAVAKAASAYRYVLNGRFTGGYITRHYGRPTDNVHAVQLELSQATYMQEQFPFSFDEGRAARIRPVLRQLLQIILEWAAH